MANLTSKIIKLTERLRSVFERKLKQYSCKKSRKTYKQWQLATIWCLMKYEKKDYRGIIDLITEMPNVLWTLGLSQLPHYTTINKFFLRNKQSWFYNVLIETRTLFSERTTLVAFDATGYSPTSASRHYVLRIFGSYWCRNYVKLSLGVDTNTQAVLAAKPRLGPRNDNIDFPFLAKRCIRKGVGGVADKGYDSERNHRLVRKLGGWCLIPPRGKVRTGRYRKKMLKEFDIDLYHRRSLVETVNSSMKRLLGSALTSRTLSRQCKELILMCIVYNAHRSVVISGFWVMFSTEPSHRNAYI